MRSWIVEAMELVQHLEVRRPHWETSTSSSRAFQGMDSAHALIDESYQLLEADGTFLTVHVHYYRYGVKLAPFAD